jgi:hypothetical protein
MQKLYEKKSTRDASLSVASTSVFFAVCAFLQTVHIN